MSQGSVVSATREGAAARVALAGELDMAARFRAEGSIEDLLGNGLRALELDLSGLTFIDSTGIGMLLDLLDRSRREDFAMRVIPAPREVMQVFEVAGLLDVLPFAAPPGAP